LQKRDAGCSPASGYLEINDQLAIAPVRRSVFALPPFIWAFSVPEG
jgi:hypothetical protein